MARLLYARLGLSDEDSVPGFERAARRNYYDAMRLRATNRRFAAIYLYGYCVETTIKAAYFRMLFLAGQQPLNTQITKPMRDQAVNHWQALQLANKPGQHDIAGWARLLVRHRASLAAQPNPLVGDFTQQMATEIVNRGDEVYNHWREYMRYRAVPVQFAELETVREDALWFRQNYDQL